ncbi:MAG TPA: hypothetical protein VFH61_09920 [Thermoleophilia bacterium]|nr:hypothetical protein [Thermoleophilia bacterium]
MRAVLGRLDPWAALLIGVLVTLTMVILLAMPGPWHKVIGLSPPTSSESTAPTDIAVFVRGADNGACTGIVWLHVDHKRLSLTASVIAPQTQGSVPGGGYVPLHRIVDDIGPQVAATSLSAVLKVDMDVWVILNDDGLRFAVPPMFRGREERPRVMLYREAGNAWAGKGGFAEAWPAQFLTLGIALPQVLFEDLNVVAFANYVLGFGIMQNDLDLQAATSLAGTLKSLRRSQVRVRACPAIVDVCRQGEAWAPEAMALGRLRHSLAVGLTPPPSEPEVVTRRRKARVLVVIPNDGWAVDAYTSEVRRRLRISAGAPVAVRVVRTPPGRLTSTVKAVVAEWRPLAVLVAPPRADVATEGTAGALQDLAAVLIRRRQPAVMSLPMGAARDAVRVATGPGDVATIIEATGVPVSRLAATQTTAEGAKVSGSASARAAARANVETLVRACWPGTLAPSLISTRLGFSFAACRGIAVGVLAPTGESARRAADRLRLWGYEATVLSSTGWNPQLTEAALYYREGMRRPALALGGDMTLNRSHIVAAKAAPADLTLVLDE